MTQGKLFGKLIPDSIFPWMRYRSFLLYLAWDLTENASTRPYTIRCFSIIHSINNTCNFGYNITNHMQNYLPRHNSLRFDRYSIIENLVQSFWNFYIPHTWYVTLGFLVRERILFWNFPSEWTSPRAENMLNIHLAGHATLVPVRHLRHILPAYSQGCQL